MELQAMLFSKGRCQAAVKLGQHQQDVSVLAQITARALQLLRVRKQTAVRLILDDQPTSGLLQYDVGHGLKSEFRFHTVGYDISANSGSTVTITGANGAHLVIGPLHEEGFALNSEYLASMQKRLEVGGL